MKKFLLILALVSTFAACKKSDSGTSTTPEYYMNYKSGSTWSYKQTNNITQLATNYTITSTTRDSTINGRAYHVFSNSTGGSQYFNVTGNDYYQYDTIPAAISTGFIERLYLKDNLAVNLTWTQIFSVNVQGLSIPITATNKMAEREITRVVNSITYTNVIHITSTLAISAPIPGLVFSATINAYYAKNIGLIENNNLINFSFAGTTQATNTTTILMSSALR